MRFLGDMLIFGKQIQTNAFDRTDVDTGQAGIFLHPTLAMVNHSCVPNAAVSFTGRQAILRAELPIEEGDEITISYIGKQTRIRKRLDGSEEPYLTYSRLHEAQALPISRAGSLPL